MSKKLHSSGNPRKFIDKIALIKQKEALTNAYFESAIQGLSDISMKRISSNDDFTINNENNAYPVEYNFSKFKDNFSNASVSPQSFTSDSTSNNPQFDNYLHGSVKQFKDPNNDVFKSLYENQNVDCGLFPTLQTHGGVKYRHGSDNSSNQFPQARFSNIEGYSPYHNILARNLDEQVSSESLPDVSSLNNRNYVHPNFDERHSSGSQHSKDLSIHESINFKKVKKGSSSKKALFEHLRNRGVQNLHHPNVLSSDQIPSNLPVNHGSPSLNRSRVGYIHNSENHGCAATNNENGHLKHYLPSNSPYLSPIRDTQINKDCDSSFRKRHASNDANSQQVPMELQLNCTLDINNCALKYKSLTPTENVQNNWFTNTNLLSPVVFGMMSADNYRRVSSDSSIQKSLDQYANISQSNFLYNNDQNLNRRNQNFKNDPKFVYQRIKSMTYDPCNNIQHTLNEAPDHFNFQRENSSSSFLDNYIDTNSIDENLDPNMDFALTPGNVPCQPFKFVELNNLSAKSNVNKSDNYGCENQQMPEQNDQCYWTQETESNSFSKEPSPKIKPCENLDLKSISVDLNTDFSCLPDIVLSDAEVPRRDSLNMADEVLNNLSMDSCNSEFLQYRDKLTGYQPMDMLTEENLSKSFENEY